MYNVAKICATSFNIIIHTNNKTGIPISLYYIEYYLIDYQP